MCQRRQKSENFVRRRGIESRSGNSNPKHKARPNGAQRVAAEIKTDLGRKTQYGGPGIQRGKRTWFRIHLFDDRGKYRVSEAPLSRTSLMQVSDRPQTNWSTVARRGWRLSGGSRSLARTIGPATRWGKKPTNRARSRAGRKSPANFVAIHVDRVGKRRERVKGYADRQDDVPRWQMIGKSQGRHGRLQVVEQESAVLEKAEQSQVATQTDE